MRTFNSCGGFVSFFAVAGWCVAMTVTPVGAATISLTGAQMATDPRVTFPNDTPTVTGTALLFGGGGPTYGKLFELEIGPVAYADEVHLTISMTRKQVDFDPKIVLTDGNRMYGGWITDDNGGSLYPVRFGDAGNRGAYDGADTGFQNGGYPDVDEAFTIQMRWRFDPGSNVVYGAFGTGSTEFALSSEYIDRAQPLKLTILRDNDPIEQYQINSISVSTVPEPACGVALVFAIGWLARRTPRKETV